MLGGKGVGKFAYSQDQLTRYHGAQGYHEPAPLDRDAWYLAPVRAKKRFEASKALVIKEAAGGPPAAQEWRSRNRKPSVWLSNPK
jgi:hypothetical protein